MIYIENDKVNNFIRRLNDKRTLQNPYFLWELTRETGGNTIYFMLDDSSSYDCSFNYFTLSASTDGSTTGGINTQLYLAPGQYRYNIYESSTPTLSVSATTGNIIETDMLVVKFDRTVNTVINKNIYY